MELKRAVPATRVERKECVTITGTVPGDRGQESGVRSQRSQIPVTIPAFVSKFRNSLAHFKESRKQALRPHLSINRCFKSLIYGASGSRRSQSPCHMKTLNRYCAHESGRCGLYSHWLIFVWCRVSRICYSFPRNTLMLWAVSSGN